MKRSTIDLWVGLFVAIGIVAVTFLSLKVANLAPQSQNQTYVLYADFSNIGGLKVKAPVKASGVVVGRVADIQLDHKSYLAHVTLEIDKRYPFSRDTSAEILTSGLLGEQYVGLTEGGDEENLKPGERIQITSSALVLEQLIGKFMLNFAEKGDKGTASSAPAGTAQPQ
jgi:phospholipid/cholesterol/gamma-HCH transport system substrate-binding protein